MLDRPVSRPTSSPSVYTDAAEPPLGDKLKTFFDCATSGPIPDRLMQLAAQLEAAFERGDLCSARRNRRNS